MGIPYAAGNRHERRSMVARRRGAYMRQITKDRDFEHDFRKDAIADRVERQQTAAHLRAVERKAKRRTVLG